MIAIERFKIIPLLLALLILAGFYLRVHRIGYYSLFTTDDGLTALGVKSIVEKGYSAFPSGALYPKELVFSHPTAWLCKIFGINEFTLRMINIPFSAGVILLVYLLGKELCSKAVGLLSAAILTFSTWEIEFTRYVRSYMLAQFLVLLAVYLFYRAFVKEEKISKVMLFMVFLLTVFTSFLGTVILILFFSLWLVKGKRFFQPTTLAFAAFFAAISFVLLETFSFFMNPIQLSYAGEVTGLASLAAKLNFARWGMLMHFIYHRQLAWFILIFAYLLSVFYFLTKFKHSLLPLLMAGSALFNLHELGFLILCFYTIAAKTKLEDFRRKSMLASIFILLLGVLCWFIYGLFFWKNISLAAGSSRILFDLARQMNLFNFPPLTYLLYFFIPFPGMTLLVAAGLLLLYLMVIQRQDRQRALFLGSLFTGMLLFLPFPIRHSAPRYNFVLYPVFVLIYSFAVIKISLWFSERLTWPKIGRKVAPVAILSVLLFFTLKHATPLEAYRQANINLGAPVKEPYIATTHNITHYFDEKSAGEYVRAHLAKEDTIVAQERAVLYYYIGRVDYYLYLLFGDEFSLTGEEVIEKNSPESDVYTKCGIIYTVAGFQNILARSRKEGRTLWLVMRNYSRRQNLEGKLANELRDAYQDLYGFLNKHPQALVFVARDNLTEVYRFDQGAL